MIDSNIVVSALFFPKGRVAALMREIVVRHSLCIASFSLEELEKVVRKKFPHELQVFDAFLNELPYEILRTPDILADVPKIRDCRDQPILASAINNDVDILLTGDKDFSEISLERPLIMTPAQFAAAYL